MNAIPFDGPCGLLNFVGATQAPDEAGVVEGRWVSRAELLRAARERLRVEIALNRLLKHVRGNDDPEALSLADLVLHTLDGIHLPETMRTAAAANIVDIWMGGNTEWRGRLEDSDFLESADWAMALALTDAVLAALPAHPPLTIPDELRELSKKAAAGPWRAHTATYPNKPVIRLDWRQGGGGVFTEVATVNAGLSQANENAKLAVAAVNFIRQALDQEPSHG